MMFRKLWYSYILHAVTQLQPVYLSALITQETKSNCYDIYSAHLLIFFTYLSSLLIKLV